MRRVCKQTGIETVQKGKTGTCMLSEGLFLGLGLVIRTKTLFFDVQEKDQPAWGVKVICRVPEKYFFWGWTLMIPMRSRMHVS